MDTLPPGEVIGLIVVDKEKRIEIEWDELEGAKEYKVYRSREANVGLKDYYKTVEGEGFSDGGVEIGETYYYAVAGVDEAGNIGRLSNKVYASVSSSGTVPTGKTSALSVLLVPKVDELLREAGFVSDQISSAESEINGLGGEEKSFAEILKIGTEIENLKRDVSNVKSGAEALKQQDLTEEALNSKVDQFYARLKIAERNIPTGLAIVEENSGIEELSDKTIKDALELENAFLSDSEYQKQLRATNKLAEENELRISSAFTKVRVDYSSGIKKEFVFVERSYDSILESVEDAYFVEMFPTGFDVSKAKLLNKNGQIEPDKNAIYFPTETKKVNYYFEEDVWSNLDSITPVLTYAPKEQTEYKSGISGFTVFFGEGASPSLYGIAGVFIVLLIVYMGIVVRRKRSQIPRGVKERIERVKKLVLEKKIDEANAEYDVLKREYRGLEDREKRKVFEIISELRTELLISEFYHCVEKYQLERDPEVVNRMKIIFEQLPEKIKAKLRGPFKAAVGDR